MPPANTLRLVVADESEDTPDPIGSIKMGKAPLSEAKESQLKAILAKYPNLKWLGLLKHDQCEIYVEEGNPLRSHPNRIAPGMKNDLKKEIDELLVLGILVPSKSPWSSPMVPLRKKATGKIRICIDYRRLNKITINDPFQMPCIEDLLNQVSNAVWLSKIDLNKGFYQVPLGRAS